MFIRLFNVNRLFITIYIIAIVTTIYGYLQLTGNDFVNWYNPYNSIITTVGNPNFASAIFAIMGVVIFSTLFIFQTNFYSFMSKVDEVDLFQIIQKKEDKSITFYIVPNKLYNDLSEEKLVEEMKSRLGEVQLKIKIVSELTRDTNSNKLKTVCCI
jgi:hypothetical protein